MGREIMNEFRDDAAASELVRDAMTETFSLLAYMDPAAPGSSTAHLLSPSLREPCCSMVDRAVLEEIGSVPDSALERVFRQVMVLDDLLREQGGNGAFLHLETLFI